MANVGRYVNCPQARKIRGNRRTLREWILWKLRPREFPDVFRVANVSAPYYPAGYKK